MPKYAHKYTSTIKLTPAETKSVKNLLNSTGEQIYNKYGMHRYEEELYEAKFADGHYAQIKIIVPDDASAYPDILAVFYRTEDDSVELSYQSDLDFFDEYQFEDVSTDEFGNTVLNSYTVKVKTTK
jgi:hypothetical protein